jgi:hypothetical protein
MVALDRHARPAGEADAFDHVRIERALGEEIGPADCLRLGLEHGDELGAVGDSLKPAEEIVAGVHVHQRDLVASAEQRHDLLRLIRSHQPMIDEHAGQLVADRLVDQNRRDRAVDPA